MDVGDNGPALAPDQTPVPVEELNQIIAEVEEQRAADRAQFDRPPEPCALDIRRALDDEELGDARLFCALFRERRVFDLSAGRWYRWVLQYWKEHGSALADVEAVVDLYKREADAAHTSATSRATDGNIDNTNENYRKALLKRIRELSRKTRQKNVLDLAAGGEAGFGTSFDRLGISGTEWDAKPYLLACENGVLELLREPPFYRFRDGRPGDYIKAAVPTKWHGIEAPALRWQQFLMEVFEDHPEIVPYIARLVGYALSGNPVERVFIILWGCGANGKSVFVGVLQATFGKNIAGQIDCELFLRNKSVRNSAAPRPDLLALRGMRLAVASETGEGRNIDAAELKRLTGMDALTGRALYSNTPVEFRQTQTLFQLTNHRPGADAADQAVWDRTHLVPFTRRFVKPGECGGDQAERPVNENLREELIQEAPGIFAWAVRGWCDYAARALAEPGNGLAPPDVVRQTTRSYRAEQDVEGRFLRECCEEVEGASVKAGNLRAAFIEWCDNNGIRTGKVGRLTALVRERHEPGPPTRRGTFYPGIRLLSEREEA
jgi:putative DNA primase/helicase